MSSVRCAGLASFRALGGGLAAGRGRLAFRSSRDGRDARTPGGPGCARRMCLRYRWLVSLAGPELQVLRGCRSKALLTKLIEEAASPEAKALVGIVEAA